ncbi:DNA polymerase alpha, subunit B [Microthyrium microscopicum]|uniref:DNA polymerase alpha subunit B n=1 Tax=Microthyrium microscopicum TaxID=703497 RepID=A0A6A6U697_9PEZI|nr:DNA polymerase alpha, subunit B [Microthyrium microscopicum]
MDSTTQELTEKFSLPSTDIGDVIRDELKSILRIHSLSTEDLSFKWESYCMKMGPDELQMNIKTMRDFRKDLQENLEQENRKKTINKPNDRRTFNATPRNATGKGDVLGMLDGLVPNTPRSGANSTNGSTIKRKGAFATPGAKATKNHAMSSPTDNRSPMDYSTPATFADRKDPGIIQESLNSHIDIPSPSEALPVEPRVKPKSNTDIPRFAYKTMAMKLSEASETLDDRIEDFVKLIQAHHNLDDVDIGNPIFQSQDEIVAVGRIACDSSEGKLNASSLVLETSRRMGQGKRVHLKLDKLPSYQFFPGKIVALRGTNASGTYFSVTEVLDAPQQPMLTSKISDIDLVNDRITGEDGSTRSVVTFVASGPYTTESELDFSPFVALLSAAEEIQADAIVLTGPFIDVEHPLVRNGDFDLPPGYPKDPDSATITDLFRAHISAPLNKLAKAMPNICVMLCPSVRDAVMKHAAWPQDRLPQPRKELGLPKQVQVVTNPMMVSLNEVLFGISSQDILEQIRMSEIAGGAARQMHPLERGCRQLVEQRHFFPVFPPVEPKRMESAPDEIPFMPLGPSLDVAYLGLGEFVGAKPDVLITPSLLPSFAKVIDSVLCINPGFLSKKRGPGTYARMVVNPLEVSDEERDAGVEIGHRVYGRCRVDIVKI